MPGQNRRLKIAVRIFNCDHLSISKNKPKLSHLIELYKEIISFYEKMHISERALSVFINYLLRYIRVPINKINTLMRELGCLSSRRTQNWVKSVIDKDDVSVIFSDLRHRLPTSDFYQIHPELEHKVKIFALERMKSKEASFDARELANTVNRLYTELYDVELDQGELIRSVSSCNRDLLRWGAYFGK
jgi:hypothetical protein